VTNSPYHALRRGAQTSRDLLICKRLFLRDNVLGMEIRYIGKQSADKKSDRAKWDAEFRKERTAHERTRRLEREMKLAKASGELIEKKVAVMQVGNLLVALRQRLLAIPEALPRCLEGRSVHEMREILHEAVCDALRELSNLPATLQAAARQEEDAGNGQASAKLGKTRTSKRKTV
jgi:hypothetical protein